MKAIDLSSIPYEHRFKGASLLISEANRFVGLPGPNEKGDPRKTLAALAYYDMALVLMKPFDPNYSTVLNWKCNLLQSLGQYEDAVNWYREIVRISDETDGKAKRNPTAALAEEMIRKYTGYKNEPLELGDAGATAVDHAPYCMVAEEFCLLLSEGRFEKAHLYLSSSLRETFPIPELKAVWQEMTGKAPPEEMSLTLEQHMVDWPDRKPDDVGWCYLSVLGAHFSEAVTVVVSRMPNNSDRITQLEFGRP